MTRQLIDYLFDVSCRLRFVSGIGFAIMIFAFMKTEFARVEKLTHYRSDDRDLLNKECRRFQRILLITATICLFFLVFLPSRHDKANVSSTKRTEIQR